MEFVHTEKYNVKASVVFEAMICAVIDAGMKIKKTDDANRRLEVSAGIGMKSWGEKIEIMVSEEDDKSSSVYMRAKPKLFTNITADLLL